MADDTDAILSPWPNRANTILRWLMVVGVVLRLQRYIVNRSLWLDEAYLAQSILTFSFHQLLTQPLMNWQAAPIGFVLLQKAAVMLLGTSEYALRIVPLIAGLASIPLFFAIIQRRLEPTAQIVAMALFVILDPLVYYSAEAKQYGTDVTIALAILWAALRVAEEPKCWRRLILLTLIGAVGIFCSHPAIFMLASMGIVLLADMARARQVEFAIRLGFAGLIWIGLFGANYVLFLGPLEHHAGLTSYWAADYMPWNFFAAARWLGVELYALYAGYSTMWLPLVDTAMIATLIAIVWLWRRDRHLLVLLILPVLLTLAAAAIHVYPFGSQLILFLVPLVVILIGQGASVIWESVLPGRQCIAVLLVASILLPTAGREAYYLVIPSKREEIKPVLAYIRDHHQPGDMLYVFRISETPFRYYETRFGLEADRYQLADMHWVMGRTDEHDPSSYRADLSNLRGKGRVWVLITHPRAMGGIDEEQLFPAILDSWGKRLDRVNAFNACALLYEMPAEK